jgi:hypothetical protein
MFSRIHLFLRRSKSIKLLKKPVDFFLQHDPQCDRVGLASQPLYCGDASQQVAGAAAQFADSLPAETQPHWTTSADKLSTAKIWPENTTTLAIIIT